MGPLSSDNSADYFSSAVAYRNPLLTVSATVVVCVLPAPVAVIVMLLIPALPLELTLIVILDVPEPGAAMEAGLKLTVWALPNPEADKVIAELKPPVTAVVIVVVPELPVDTVNLFGDAPMVKSAETGAVTVRVTVAEGVMPPPVPVTVIG